MTDLDPMPAQPDAGRLAAQIRREMVVALEHGPSTLETYPLGDIGFALHDRVIVTAGLTGTGRQVYAPATRVAILHALADGPAVLSNHPHDAVQAALANGVIRSWGPSATGRTVYAPTAEGDDFRPIDGPSLASVHRRWLDLGLPAHTWPAFAKLHGENPRIAPAADQVAS